MYLDIVLSVNTVDLVKCQGARVRSDRFARCRSKLTTWREEISHVPVARANYVAARIFDVVVNNQKIESSFAKQTRSRQERPEYLGSQSPSTERLPDTWPMSWLGCDCATNQPSMDACSGTLPRLSYEPEISGQESDGRSMANIRHLDGERSQWPYKNRVALSIRPRLLNKSCLCSPSYSVRNYTAVASMRTALMVLSTRRLPRYLGYLALGMDTYVSHRLRLTQVIRQHSFPPACSFLGRIRQAGLMRAGMLPYC